jgi:AcrR family transcriptional regulator
VPPGGFTRTPLSEYRLPAGRRNLSREQVEESQRWRLLVAAAQLFAERGYKGTKSGEVAGRACVSRATFYKYFDNIDDCLLAAYEMSVDCLCDVVAMACKGRTDQADRLKHAVEDALEFLAAEPVVARLLGSEALAGVRSIAAVREGLVSRLTAMLDAGGRPQETAGADPLAGVNPLLLEGALTLAGGAANDDLRRIAPELTQVLTGRLRPEQDSHLPTTP